MPLLYKYLITAGLVVLISEVAKHSDRLGALIASLPMVTILAMLWLHLEHQPAEKIANHAWYTFWYVIPTLPMFALFPLMISRWGFWPALGGSVIITITCFGIVGLIAKLFGVTLW